MTVALTSTTDVLSTASISFYSARCAWVSPVCSITSGVAAGWLLRYDIPALNVASVVKVRVTNTGTAALQLQAGVWMMESPTGAILGSVAPAPVTIAAGAAYTWELTPPVVPAATVMRVGINLGATAAAGSQFTVREITSAATATATELVGATLERNSHSEAADSGASGVSIVTRGPVGGQRARLVYLCDSLPIARMLDTIHQGSAPVVLSGDTAGDLAGLSYYLVGRLQLAPEKALPGRPAKWLASVEGQVA